MAALWTIPPHEPFVDALAAGLLDEAAGDALVLADMQVFLPTRRACRSLRDAFLRQGGGTPLMLPQIQPLGEVDPLDLLAQGALAADLPPAIAPLRRRLLLARLLSPMEPQLEHRLRLADELAALLDELQTERVPLAAIADVVPEELAAHWQRTRELLEILGEVWPKVLEEEQALDPAERRDRLLRGLAAWLAATRPTRRIVAAGSTGSIPATRTLLRAILTLERGAIVLPGLDTGLDETSWAALGPGHPQAGLRQLLEELGRTRGDVALWPGRIAGRAPDRLPLMREATRPAETIQLAPKPAPGVDAARAGLEVDVLPDQASEALSLALRMRDALEVPGRRAALVTADRALARRVALELRRFGIEVDDSAGIPLDQTPTGAFLLLIARLLQGVAPVPLLAVLKHPLVRMGREAAGLRAEVRTLERACLRGPHVADGFAGILDELTRAARDPRREKARERLERLHRFVSAIEELCRPFLDLQARPEVDLDQLLTRHLALAEALAAVPRPGRSQLWAHESGETAALLCHDLREAARGGHPLAPGAYAALLGLAMAGRPVRSRAPRHPRLAILGQLEARLQQADLVLIGGLNEGVWPAPVDSGPWLNRTMREQLRLPPVERRIGQAAHDLQQLIAAPEVVLTRAERDAAGAPTVPSRWLVRLQTLLGAAPASPWGAWAARLDLPDQPPRPVAQPEPAPPLAARPRSLSVSDIGLWMRDPYALYARRVLKLGALDPLEADPRALERGTLLHEVLEAFVRACPDQLPPDALRRLLDLITVRLEAFAHRPQVRAFWKPRFEQAARWYLDQEAERRPELAQLLVEVVGRLELAGPGGPFEVRARADRIERTAAGGLRIIDYKTGRVPEVREVRTGREPQLPLEALMVTEGAFEDVRPGEVEGLCFWSLKGHARGGEARCLSDPEELVAAARAGLGALIAHYDDPATPYPARLRPDMGQPREYDHLARFKEWAS